MNREVVSVRSPDNITSTSTVRSCEITLGGTATNIDKDARATHMVADVALSNAPVVHLKGFRSPTAVIAILLVMGFLVARFTTSEATSSIRSTAIGFFTKMHGSINKARPNTSISGSLEERAVPQWIPDSPEKMPEIKRSRRVHEKKKSKPITHTENMKHQAALVAENQIGSENVIAELKRSFKQGRWE